MVVFSDRQRDVAGVRVTTVQTTDGDIELQVRLLLLCRRFDSVAVAESRTGQDLQRR